jgi:hypothetical protein
LVEEEGTFSAIGVYPKTDSLLGLRKTATALCLSIRKKRKGREVPAAITAVTAREGDLEN